MSSTERSRFRRTLKAKQAELERLIRNRDAITIERGSEDLEEGQNAAELEIAIRNLDRETLMLRDVRDALHRLEENSFGICVECDEEISLKRLVAVPWTPYCIVCRQAADSRDVWSNEGVLSNAA